MFLKCFNTMILLYGLSAVATMFFASVTGQIMEGKIHVAVVIFSVGLVGILWVGVHGICKK